MRKHLLLSLSHITRHYSWWVVMAVLALAILAIFSLQDLKLDSSFKRLLPRNAPILEKFDKYQQAFQEAQVITILLVLSEPPPSPGEGVAKLLEAAQKVQESLLKSEEIVSADYRKRRDLLSLPINLRGLSEESLQKLSETLAQLRALAPGQATPGGSQPLDATYASIRSALEQLLSGLGVLNPPALAEALVKLDVRLKELRQLNAQVYAILERLPEDLQQGEERLDKMAQLLLSWQSAFLPPPSDSGTDYKLSKDMQALLIEVRPRQSSQISLEYNRKVIQILQSTLTSLDLKNQGIDWGLKGPYVFSAETDEALHKDMERTAIITHFGVLLLFIFLMKRLLYPLLTMVPILIAVIFTLFGAKVLFGGLNALTAFLPAIVLGMGIDYGIQFISHYLEERDRSRRCTPALRATLITKGSAMLIAACAASLVLFGLGVVARSNGLKEMGFILGLGVLLSCLLTLLLLPALIVAAHSILGRRLWRRVLRPWDLYPLIRLLIRGRWIIIGITIAGTIALAWPASHVRFSFITEALMPKNLPSQQVRTYIEQHFELQQMPEAENYFLFFVEPSEEVVRAVSEGLDGLEALDQPTISFYSLIPRPEEIEVIKQRINTLRELDPITPLEQEANRLARLQEQFARQQLLEGELAHLEEQLQRGSETVLKASGDEELAAELSPQLRDSTRVIRERLEQLRPAKLEDKLQVLRFKLADLIKQVRSIVRAIPTAQEIDSFIQNPPEELKAKFFTPDGKAIIYAHIRREWLWNSILYDRFIREASGIWSDFLGLPMMTATIEDFMQRDFWWSTALAALIIFVVLRLDFARSPVRGATGLSLITLGLGYLWMLGVLNLMRIDFNVANILISPLLIGLGVDNCVYLLHRHQDLGQIERATASTALPILANALATMIGFGSLILAKTSALHILGESAAMGIGFITLLSLTLLPAVVSLRSPGRGSTPYNEKAGSR